MTQVQCKTLTVVTLFLATCSFLPDAQAHRIRNSIVTVTFYTDSTYRIEIHTNMEAVLTGIGPQHGDTQDAPNVKAYDALRALPPAGISQVRPFPQVDVLAQRHGHHVLGCGIGLCAAL